MIYLLVFLIICILFVIAISIYDNKKLIVREYVVETDKIDRDMSIAFLSDLHGAVHGCDNCEIIDKIHELQPSIVVMGGDMITARVEQLESGQFERLESLIQQLGDYPIYYSVGNHEYRMNLYREDFGNAYDTLVKRIKGAGATFLENDSINIENNIQLQGFMLNKKYYTRIEKNELKQENVRAAIGLRDNEKYRILLAHNPEYYDTYSTEADLILSGHTHGGIAVLPVLGGVISPRLCLFPKYDGGRFDENDSTMIISRGLGSHTIKIRIFNPCEICLIKLKKSV